ncbi:hypothetical protein QN277_010781 [Acacia crassicarpa]|nr:hypothetical protein QN277_010781 [Acacia crassicarpa]
MEVVYRILSYLKLDPGRGIFFKKGTTRNIEIYTDADHARDRETRRSISGYCTYVWGNLVTWRSKKQTVVSPSSAEAELRAINKGVCEGMWIIILLKELGIQHEEPMNLWCDNKTSIEMVKNPIYHDQTKHVDIDRHFIKEKIEVGIMTLSHIRSEEQIADILTKPLGRTKFERFCGKLGLLDIYSSA